MIVRFRKVSDHLYRGGDLSPRDVRILKNKFHVNRIVSLDADVAKRIDRTTKLLGIEHIKLPMDITNKASILNLFKHPIDKLFDKDKITFVGCKAGKDRTGLAVALYRCEVEHWTCDKAISEAKHLGFGAGIDPTIISTYLKLIRKACECHKEDISNAYDIVSNEREYPSSFSDYEGQESWAPYSDYRVKEFPFATVDNEWPEQYQSRQDYGLDDSEPVREKSQALPQSGTYDTSTNGINGAGPSMVGSGYV